MSNWTAAEILLGAAVLVLAMPREDGFVIPERRDWLGWLKRLRPGTRRRREEEAGHEAERYVTDLRTDQEPMTVRQDQLPSLNRKFSSTVLTTAPEGQRPPWQAAENPARAVPQEAREKPEEKPRRRAPGDPPTVVFEIMRPAIAGDLGRYLEELPSYADLGSSPDPFFVPRSSFALGVPDHDGAPHHVGDHESEENGGDPLQDSAGNAEVDSEEGREKAPGD